jgi:hypothetical protein
MFTGISGWFGICGQTEGDPVLPLTLVRQHRNLSTRNGEARPSKLAKEPSGERTAKVAPRIPHRRNRSAEIPPDVETDEETATVSSNPTSAKARHVRAVRGPFARGTRKEPESRDEATNRKRQPTAPQIANLRG